MSWKTLKIAVLYNNLLRQKPPSGVTHLQLHCLLLNACFLRWCRINSLCLRNIWLFFKVTWHNSQKQIWRPGGQGARKRLATKGKETRPCLSEGLPQAKKWKGGIHPPSTPSTHTAPWKPTSAQILSGFVLPSGHLGHPTQACHPQGSVQLRVPSLHLPVHQGATVSKLSDWKEFIPSPHWWTKDSNNNGWVLPCEAD